MGYDLFRFQEQVDAELLCPICRGVLEEPLIASRCEHTFCKGCINEWLLSNSSCPIDRQHVTHDDLKPIPRILKNFLSRLLIRCDNATLGCADVVELEHLKVHQEGCEYDPKRNVPCEKDCGLILLRGELSQHNCIRELRSEIRQDIQSLTVGMDNYNSKMQLSQQNFTKLRSEINEMGQDIYSVMVGIESCNRTMLETQQNLRSMRKEICEMGQNIQFLKADMKNRSTEMQIGKQNFLKNIYYLLPIIILWLFLPYVSS